MVGESRTDLLNWVNNTLELNYTKVEHFGNGAVYCQLLDSIYEDVPMSKVNFDSKNEYEHLNNMKVLQLAFNKHGITKKIQVERLVKCRLQDNLELLQWFKKYWSENKNFNAEYNPVLRRKAKRVVSSRASSGNGMAPPGMGSGSNSSSRISSGTGAGAGTRTLSGTRTPNGIRTPSRGGSRVSSASNGVHGNSTTSNTRTPSSTISGTASRPSTALGISNRRVTSNPIHGPHSIGNDNSITSDNISTNNKLNQLNNDLADSLEHVRSLSKENDDYKISLGALETERNFYYNKLRQIEVFTNNKLDELNGEDITMGDITNDESHDRSNGAFTKGDIITMLNQINEYLYATSEGFQENDEEEEEEGEVIDQDIAHENPEVDADHVDADNLDAESF